MNYKGKVKKKSTKQENLGALFSYRSFFRFSILFFFFLSFGILLFRFLRRNRTARCITATCTCAGEENRFKKLCFYRGQRALEANISPRLSSKSTTDLPRRRPRRFWCHQRTLPWTSSLCPNRKIRRVPCTLWSCFCASQQEHRFDPWRCYKNRARS